LGEDEQGPGRGLLRGIDSPMDDYQVIQPIGVGQLTGQVV
jgi:hypothetical protein